jgi:2-hydroxychromene-2-carboxylate isomerase
MGVKALIGPMVSRAITSNRRRDMQRRWFEAARVRSGKPHEVLYFHQVDDPYSALMAGRLAGLVAQYGVLLTPRLVPPPPGWAAPEREKLAAYAQRDAALIAPAFGLDHFDRVTPSDAEVERAQSILQSAIDAGRFAEAAPVVARALGAGESLDVAAAEFGAATPAAVARALEEGGRLRERLGHYLGATLYHAGEWYWGLDRLGDLEMRLRALGCSGGGSLARPLAARQKLKFGETVRAADPGTPALEMFLSFRSPYTYLAMERVLALVSHYGLELRLRFVLPMVMRGLPVPAAKRTYILRDCKREAERLGLPFGSVCDPVGRPVERGLAILNGAMATGAGPAFADSFLRGVFAEAVDAGSDRGLRQLVERAGLDWQQARVWMADESWRAVAEDNRRSMFADQLWGVPSFRFGALSTWGQDRLWLVEQAIVETLGGPKDTAPDFRTGTEP